MWNRFLYFLFQNVVPWNVFNWELNWQKKLNFYSYPGRKCQQRIFSFWESVLNSFLLLGWFELLRWSLLFKIQIIFGGVKPRFFVQVWNLSHALISPSFLSPPPAPPPSYPAHNLSLTQILSEPPEKGAL